MKCLDDCHTYELDQFGRDKPVFGSALPQILRFYEMRENGDKIDGVTIEEVLRVLIHRLSVLNAKMPCHENAYAIEDLQGALDVLEERTKDRARRNVEGTHAL